VNLAPYSPVPAITCPKCLKKLTEVINSV
jgi:hypothetical protein